MKKNKKLKIVFLDFDDIKNPLLGAGQARATLEVAKRLIKNGHKVTVITSKYPKSKDRHENGIFYKHVGLGSKNIRLNNIVYILTLPFYSKKINADIIVECFTPPFSTLFTPVISKVPVVALPTSFEAERFSDLYHLPFNKVEQFGLKFYKYFLPYTEYQNKKMKKINPNIFSKIVPEGVGEEYFKIKREKPSHILFLGRLDMNQKGLDLLLKAYSKVQNKIEFPLVIAGFGPDEEKIKKMISDLDLNNKVKLVGPAYNSKKIQLLSKTLYVAFPSRHEGFSLFSLEALASGLPLVAFDIPSLSWTNKKTVLKAKPFDINEYSKLLRNAANKNSAAKLRRSCRPYVKKYTWENVANNFESFFFQVLKNERFKNINKN